MSQDKALTRKKLTALWRSGRTPVLPTRDKKYVLLSDVHLGDKGEADDFRANEKALLRALSHYKSAGFDVILLGDIEEFWQFDLEAIRTTYDKTVYKALRAFGDSRIHRVFGNHDIEWGALIDPARTKPPTVAAADEALILKDKSGRKRLLLVHGHQGSTESDKTSWFSRFWVRIFGRFEGIAKTLGLYGHTSATKSQIAKDYERIMYGWAKQAKVVLVCGHSHRAIFGSRSLVEKLDDRIKELQRELQAGITDTKKRERKLKELREAFKKQLDEEYKNRKITPTEKTGRPTPCYFNTGCALYSDGLTVIEIADDQIRLVKWHRKPKGSQRHVVFEEASLSDVVKATIG